MCRMRKLASRSSSSTERFYSLPRIVSHPVHLFVMKLSIKLLDYDKDYIKYSTNGFKCCSLVSIDGRLPMPLLGERINFHIICLCFPPFFFEFDVKHLKVRRMSNNTSRINNSIIVLYNMFRSNCHYHVEGPVGYILAVGAAGSTSVVAGTSAVVGTLVDDDGPFLL